MRGAVCVVAVSFSALRVMIRGPTVLAELEDPFETIGVVHKDSFVKDPHDGKP